MSLKLFLPLMLLTFVCTGNALTNEEKQILIDKAAERFSKEKPEDQVKSYKVMVFVYLVSQEKIEALEKKNEELIEALTKK
jgi:hypothetical protein